MGRNRLFLLVFRAILVRLGEIYRFVVCYCRGFTNRNYQPTREKTMGVESDG